MRPDIFLSAVLLCCHFGLTTVLLRLARSMSPVIIHLLSAIFVSGSFIVIGLLTTTMKLYNLWSGLSLLAFGIMVFLFAYSAIYKSISLRLLVEGADAHPCAVSIERLNKQTVLPRFMDRINLLINNGYLLEENERVIISASGRRLCDALIYWRISLGFPESGLYYSSKEMHKTNHFQD